MKLFGSVRKAPGWMAFTFQDGAFCAAHIKRSPGARPTVDMAMVGKSDVLTNSLDKLGKEWQASRYQCTTLLDRTQYSFLPVDAPNVPPTELKSAISWMIRDMIDFPIDDATVDALDIPLDKDAPVRNRTMYAVVAHSKTIEQRQDLFTKAHISLKAIDIPEMAQRNVAALMDPYRGLAMLSFDETGGLLTVTFASELILARRIDVNYSQMRQRNATEAIDRVGLEVQRSLEYFERQYHFIGVQKLVLAPLADMTIPLLEHLTGRLPIPVEPLRLEDVLDISLTPGLQDPEVQLQSFLTLGAALRHEEKSL
jgi:MSHA biogenesis protein MshI